MILADTAVWIDHFRSDNKEMHHRLERRGIAIHPFVVAELALGSLRNRGITLSWLDCLPRVPVARLEEVRMMIEVHSLYSRGIGLVDAHLIASCFIHPPTLLWSHNKRLHAVAESLGISADLP